MDNPFFSRRAAILGLVGNWFAFTAQAQQTADAGYVPDVITPAFNEKMLRVVIDEAHNNFHTASGLYLPFAKLLRADGLTVEPGKESFSASSLADANMLVIANARSVTGPTGSAFTREECGAVEQWVKGGGGLWLIADHAPFGAAAQDMAKTFGSTMGGGWAYEPDSSGKASTQIVFESKKGGLGDHPIMRGRNSKETIRRLRSYTGQSLTLPAHAVGLLNFGNVAYEASSFRDLEAANETLKKHAFPSDNSVVDRVQGFAMEYGSGRIVVLGEAAMVTAQQIKVGNGQAVKVGLDVSGYDNEQFATNTARWLLRAL